MTDVKTIQLGVLLYVGAIGYACLAQDPRQKYRCVVTAVGRKGKWVPEGLYEGHMLAAIEFHSDDQRSIVLVNGDQFEFKEYTETRQVAEWQSLTGKFLASLKQNFNWDEDQVKTWLDERLDQIRPSPE